MAKSIRKKDVKRKALREEHLPFTKQNYLIIGAGIVVIVVGYLALLAGGVEGFLPLVIAPILLVAGYCVILPIGILYKKSYVQKQDAATEQPNQPA